MSSAASSSSVSERWVPEPMGNDPQSTDLYEEDVRYVELEHILKSDKKGVLIRAAMGTGKSTCIRSVINKQLRPHERVLLISPRKTFTQAIVAELNSQMKGDKFVSYMDKKASLTTASRVAVQFESLHLLSGENVAPFAYVIVDECESGLTQAISAQTNGTHIKQNQALFEGFVRRAKRVFLMDAFLGARTFRMVKTMGFPYTFLWYLRKPARRTAIRYDHFFGVKSSTPVKERIETQFRQYLAVLFEQLRQGKRIYAFFSSRDKLLEVRAAIENVLPGLKILMYHGKKGNDLSNVREDWRDVNLVMTTTSITVGVDYNYSETNHPEWMFDKVFVYASASSHNLVRDIFQSTMRVRHLTDNELHYFLDPTPMGCKFDKKREKLMEEQKQIEREGKFLVSDEYGHVYHATNQLWLDITVDGIQEALTNGRKLQEIFAYYLRVNNYTDSTVKEADLNDDDDFTMEKLCGERQPYDQVAVIDKEQMREYKKRQISDDPSVARLTPLEQASLDRYYFDRTIPEDLDHDSRTALWALHYKIGREKCNNIRYELGRARGLVSMADLIADQTCSMFNTPVLLQAKVIETICSRLGVSNVAELQTVSLERWERLITNNRLADVEGDARSAFGLPKSKKPETWISNCVDRWVGGSFTRDRRLQRRINGVQTDVQGYTLAPHHELLPASAPTEK